MSFQWFDFLTVAGRLASMIQVQRAAAPGIVPPPTFSLDEVEAVCRTIASRAYYAVFKTALEGVIERGGGELQAQTSQHDALVRYLRNSDRPLWRRIGHNLHRLSTVRRTADYDRELVMEGRPVCPANLANQALAQAGSLANDIRTAFPPR